MPPNRPRLTPAVADVRRAVRAALAPLRPESGRVEPGTRVEPVETSPAGPVEPAGAGTRVEPVETSPAANPLAPLAPLVLVALSGGPDSLALAAATAFEAPRAGIRAGAVIVDHGLQPGSRDAAERAATQARQLGLDPVLIRSVDVGHPASHGGPEAAARAARYRVLHETMQELDAAAILLGHTLDDQAETVLLGLARGSGPASLAGMRPRTPAHEMPAHETPAHRAPAHQAPAAAPAPRRAAGSREYLRPLLGIRRATTVQACTDAGLEPWLDPHNDDGAYTRVRVRRTVLPVVEQELGPGIHEALARTADQLREDSDALDHFAEELAEDLAEHSEAGISLPVAALAANPAALRQRLIRLAVASEFHVHLSRAQTLEVARLVTDWSGQAGVDLPGVRVERHGPMLRFSARETPPTTAPPTGYEAGAATKTEAEAETEAEAGATPTAREDDDGIR